MKAHENRFGVNGRGNSVNDTAFSEAWVEARETAGSRRVWAGLALAGAVIGLAGPFGTFETLGVAARVGYWLGITVTTYWLGFVVAIGIAIYAERRGLRPAPALVLGALVAAVPITGWIAGAHALIFGQAFWADFARLLPYVLVLSPAATLLSAALVDPPGTGPEPAPDPSWLDKLPPKLGRDLLLLQAEDHYVRAETLKGEALIRGRLQDAADSLGGTGIRIHRSWWVARDAVTALRSEAGVPVVVLKDGRTLPVGRTYRKRVRAALGR
ncbi:MAG: LytTR family DNA-binding domain-containing protein [Pseudomonadota bacterium]